MSIVATNIPSPFRLSLSLCLICTFITIFKMYTYEEHISLYIALLFSLPMFLTYEKLALDLLSTLLLPI